MVIIAVITVRHLAHAQVIVVVLLLRPRHLQVVRQQATIWVREAIHATVQRAPAAVPMVAMVAQVGAILLRPHLLHPPLLLPRQLLVVLRVLLSRVQADVPMMVMGAQQVAMSLQLLRQQVSHRDQMISRTVLKRICHPCNVPDLSFVRFLTACS